jgi:hypothetical protein
VCVAAFQTGKSTVAPFLFDAFHHGELGRVATRVER